MGKSKETFSKKEKEKKRLKQKQDKKLKSEERKANKKDGNSLESMMAYLDENGNLTDKAPDPSKKKVFRQEDIEISVIRKPEEPATFRMGMVSFFNTEKGFGFINDLTTRERVFFHVNDLLEQIEESDKVQYMAEHGPRGLSAVQVSRVK
jgi:cold shock CspA family protein